MESEGALPSPAICLVKRLWSKIFQVERIDPGGSRQINYASLVSPSAFRSSVVSFDSDVYGSSCSIMYMFFMVILFDT